MWESGDWTGRKIQGHLVVRAWQWLKEGTERHNEQDWGTHYNKVYLLVSLLVRPPTRISQQILDGLPSDCLQTFVRLSNPILWMQYLGNASTYGTKIQLDSRMNQLEFCGLRSKVTVASQSTFLACWIWYFKATSTEFLHTVTWTHRWIGLNFVVKGQGQCHLTKHIFGP